MKSHSYSCQTLSCTLKDNKTVILLGNFVIWLSNFVNNVFYSTFFNVSYFFIKNAFFKVFYSWGQRLLHL